MRALTLAAPTDLKLTEVPEPASSGDVLLRVEMVGLCGSDLNSFRGLNPLITYPRIPGHEIAATVVEGTPTLAPGSRVTVSPYTSCGQCSSCRIGRVNACQFNQTLGVQRDGALCEWLRVPESKVYASSKLNYRELALVEPLTVGFHAVARGRVKAEDTVAVYGCGGVGLGAIAGASFRGAETIAIDQDDAKLQLARAAGARHTIDTREGKVTERLREITGGSGPAVVIEAIGLAATYQAAVEQVAFGGRVVYIGYAKQPIAFETRYFVQKELDILGSRNALPENFLEVIAMLEDGRFPVDAAISEVISMEDAERSMKRWASDPASVTKLLVQVSR